MLRLHDSRPGKCLDLGQVPFGGEDELAALLTSPYKPEGCDEDTLIVDSMPIMTCNRKKSYGQSRSGNSRQDIS